MYTCIIFLSQKASELKDPALVSCGPAYREGPLRQGIKVALQFWCEPCVILQVVCSYGYVYQSLINLGSFINLQHELTDITLNCLNLYIRNINHRRLTLLHLEQQHFKSGLTGIYRLPVIETSATNSCYEYGSS